jgi:hypothetical protein
MTKFKKIYNCKIILIKTIVYVLLYPYKERCRAGSSNIKFLIISLFGGKSLAYLNLVPNPYFQCGSGSADPIESWSNPDPVRIRNIDSNMYDN